nr:mitochondrial import inner membrane translocase subunit tim44-2 [Ipomoea batatas]
MAGEMAGGEGEGALPTLPVGAGTEQLIQVEKKSQSEHNINAQEVEIEQVVTWTTPRSNNQVPNEREENKMSHAVTIFNLKRMGIYTKFLYLLLFSSLIMSFLNCLDCRNKEFQQSIKELKEKVKLKGVKEDLKTSETVDLDIKHATDARLLIKLPRK